MKTKANILCARQGTLEIDILSLIPETVRASLGTDRKYEAFFLVEPDTVNPLVTDENGKEIDVSIELKETLSIYSLICQAMDSGTLIPALDGHSPEGYKIATIVGASRVGEKVIIVVCYDKEYENLCGLFPSCSIELEYESSKKNDTTNTIKKVLQVMAVALLREDIPPAFENAKKLGTVFAERRNVKMELSTVKFSELVGELRARKVKFDQLFDFQELLGREKEENGKVVFEGGDRVFKEHVYAMRDSIQAKGNKRIQELEAELTKVKSELEEKSKVISRFEISKELADAISALDISDEEKTYYMVRSEEFDGSIPVADWLKKLSEEFKKIFGDSSTNEPSQAAAQTQTAAAQKKIGPKPKPDSGSASLFGVDDA